jgi:hypothetical protein
VNTIKDLFALAETSAMKIAIVGPKWSTRIYRHITIFGKRFVYLTDEELTAWCQDPNVKFSSCTTSSPKSS